MKHYETPICLPICNKTCLQLRLWSNICCDQSNKYFQQVKHVIYNYYKEEETVGNCKIGRNCTDNESKKATKEEEESKSKSQRHKHKRFETTFEFDDQNSSGNRHEFIEPGYLCNSPKDTNSDFILL